MKREPVDSSAIRSTGYDADKRKLQIEFRSRAVYDYAGVPKAKATRLRKAPSVGRDFNSSIKDKYPFRKVRNAAKKRRSFKPKRRR